MTSELRGGFKPTKPPSRVRKLRPLHALDHSGDLPGPRCSSVKGYRLYPLGSLASAPVAPPDAGGSSHISVTGLPTEPADIHSAPPHELACQRARRSGSSDVSDLVGNSHASSAQRLHVRSSGSPRCSHSGASRDGDSVKSSARTRCEIPGSSSDRACLAGRLGHLGGDERRDWPAWRPQS